MYIQSPYLIEKKEYLNKKRNDLIEEISNAFEWVTLEDGIGLHEAEAIDDWLKPTDNEYINYKNMDERFDWKVLLSDTEENEINYKSRRCFSDAKWKRFALAPYMITLLQEKDFAHIVEMIDLYESVVVIDFVVKNNDLKEWTKEEYCTLFSLLSPDQIQSIKDFLNFDIELATYWSELLQDNSYIDNIEKDLHQKSWYQSDLNQWISSKENNLFLLIEKRKIELESIEKNWNDIIYYGV